MDRDVVAESIMRNCKKEECLKSMRMEMARFGNSFCVPNFAMQECFPQLPYGMPAPLSSVSPYPYRWPLTFSIPPALAPCSFPLPNNIQFFADMFSVRNQRPATNETKNISMVDRKNASDIRVNKSEAQVNEGTCSSSGMKLTNNSNIEDSSSLKVPRFKRPKNVQEYNILMEAVRRNPSKFPKVLGKEKTQFLSILGIAPKSICSSKTLKKFRQEHRFKQLMNRSCRVYRERKLLRDKNKLKKYSQEKKRIFLRMPPCKDINSTLCQKESSNGKETSKKSRKLKVSRKLYEKNGDCFQKTKRMKISHFEEKKTFEVIDIASSDDEIQEENINSFKTNDKEKEVMKGEDPMKFLNDRAIEASKRNTLDANKEKEVMKDEDPMKVLNDRTIETSKTNTLDADKEKEVMKDEDPMKVLNDRIIETSKTNILDAESKRISEEKYKNENINCRSSEETKLEPSQNTSVSTSKPLVNKIDIVNVEPILLHDNTKKVPIVRNVSSHQVLPLSSAVCPKIVTSQKSYARIVPKNFPNYSLPSTNLVPVDIRQLMPLLEQQSSEVSNKNTQRIVYPIQVSPSLKNAAIFMINKDQKEAIYLIPQKSNRPILPHDVRKTEHPVPSSAEQPKVLNSVASLPSQTFQLKQTNTAEKIGEKCPVSRKTFGKEKAKINISEEMDRIFRWMYMMKANLNPSMFQHGIENCVQKLLSQLDMGILLVKEAKRSLMEIENSVGGQTSFADDQ